MAEQLTTPSSDRPLRADAARNRERVLVAAKQVFAEHGLDASIAEVARVAGVGKATIFRSFATKDELIAAIALEKIEWAGERARIALEQDDAWQAFRSLLFDYTERHARDLIQGEILARTSAHPELVAARERVGALMTELMDRAKAQGKMRADATSADLHLLFRGLAAALEPDERRDVEVWRRWSDMFANALRAD